jgi:iron(III) transport system substrate-binding protein
MIVPDQERREPGVLLLPNAALIIKGGPHPENARKLMDYLLSKETERKLASADCAQIPLHSGVEMPSYVPRIDALKVMPVDIGEVARNMEAIQSYLKSWSGY